MISLSSLWLFLSQSWLRFSSFECFSSLVIFIKALPSSSSPDRSEIFTSRSPRAMLLACSTTSPKFSTIWFIEYASSSFSLFGTALFVKTPLAMAPATSDFCLRLDCKSTNEAFSIPISSVVSTLISLDKSPAARLFRFSTTFKTGFEMVPEIIRDDRKVMATSTVAISKMLTKSRLITKLFNSPMVEAKRTSMTDISFLAVSSSAETAEISGLLRYFWIARFTFVPLRLASSAMARALFIWGLSRKIINSKRLATSSAVLRSKLIIGP